MTDPATYLLSFLIICFISSLVMTGVRVNEAGAFFKETVRLFLTVSGGILIFAAVVWVLECIFIRPLV